MLSLGYKERFNAFLKNKKLFLSLLIVSSILTAIDLVFFVLLVKYENFKSVYFINLPILLVISSMFVFFLIRFLYEKKELKFLKHLFTQYLNIIDGKVIEIEENNIIYNFRSVTKVVVQEEDTKLIVYFESSLGEIPFKVNDDVLIKIADNFILEYEVKNNEIH